MLSWEPDEAELVYQDVLMVRVLALFQNGMSTIIHPGTLAQAILAIFTGKKMRILLTSLLVTEGIVKIALIFKGTLAQGGGFSNFSSLQLFLTGNHS